MKIFNRNMTAFTLAEVLITLGIIGVIASLTVPSLLQGTEEKATVTAVKKTYSTLSNAYKLAEKDEGTPDNWGMDADYTLMLGKLKPYLNVSKDCLNGSTGCFPAGVTYKHLAASSGDEGFTYDSVGYPKLKLADGTLLYGVFDNGDCTGAPGSSPALQSVCGYYIVDVNGYKNPNQWGKDTFFFFLTKFGIVPWGSVQDDTYTFASNCSDINNADGSTCAAWVMYNENLDYTHCDGLSWDGPTKCH